MPKPLRTSARIRDAGGEAWSFQADVTDAACVKSLFDTIRERCGRLDVLVNNAGSTYESLFAFTAPDRFWDVMRSNVQSTVLCSQAAIRMMLQQKSGAIVNITSTAGIRSPIGLSAYAAAKAAVNSLTVSVAREVAGRGIRVNAIAPSWVETDMTQEANTEKIQAAVKAIPLGRMARAEEVAAAVSAVLRDDMTYLVGHVLTLNGGGGG